jgi:DNA-binding transcriptional LysR family regulator
VEFDEVPFAKIDLPILAAFVAACDWPSMAQAAESLGISPSTMTGRVKGLEADLGLKLFGRHGRHSLPLVSAVWLYDRSVRLLLAEEFLRSSGRVGRSAIRTVVVHLDAAYSGTYLALAIREVIRGIHSEPLDCFIDLTFSGATRTEFEASRLPLLASPTATLVISTSFPKRSATGVDAARLNDRWVTLARGNSASNSVTNSGGKLVIPELPGTLNEDIAAQLNRVAGAGKISTAPISLQDRIGLELLLEAQPLLLPQSLLPRLTGGSTTAIAPFAWLNSDVSIKRSGSDPVADLLIERLRVRLSNWGAIVPVLTAFRPAVAMKQVKIMNHAITATSMASAGRATGLSASVAATKIAGLEATLGSPLLIKDRRGSRPADLALELHPICIGMARLFDAISATAVKASAQFEQSIRLGLPPSWSSDSLTAASIGAALARFCAAHPGCDIEVVEGARDALNAGVRLGHLNVAVVGRAGHHVGRLHTGFSEDLSLIINKQAGFRPAGRSVTPEEFRGLQLILAPEQLTMHQTFLSELAKAGVYIVPRMRIGSIPLIVSIVRRIPVGTILPASVVYGELQEGIVEAFPLHHIVPRRRLWTIFSTEQQLSELERDLIQEIKTEFTTASMVKNELKCAQASWRRQETSITGRPL